MLENLNVATFKNGLAIPEVQDKDAWENASDNQQAAWCYYDNDPKNGEKYGKLYNWFAVVDTNGLCPQGWHVPSDADWDTLVKYLGGDSAADKLKAKPIIKKTVSYYNTGGYYLETSCNNCSRASAEYKKICPVCKGTGSVTTNKYIPKSKEKYNKEESIGGFDGTNESGFTGLPGGCRQHDGDYDYIGRNGYWWSSSEYKTYDTWNRYWRYYYRNYVYNEDTYKKIGFSMRCLRD